MPIYQGSTRIDRIELGPLILGSPIDQLYVGEDLVHQRYREQWHDYTVSTTVTAPSWARFVNLVALGGGGGGSGGGAISTADGGRAGSWSHTRQEIAPGTRLQVSLGHGGNGAFANTNNGGSGGTTTIQVDGGAVLLSAPGGGPGTSIDGNNPGRGAGNRTVFGRTFVGGGNASANENGKRPGGGGGPGARWTGGGAGAHGAAFVGFTSH